MKELYKDDFASFKFFIIAKGGFTEEGQQDIGMENRSPTAFKMSKFEPTLSIFSFEMNNSFY